VLSRGFSYAPADPCFISSTIATDRLRRAGMLVLALILVTTGSYIRERVAEERSELDWLVIVQVGLALAGAYLGTQLIRRHPLSGFGTTVLAVYLLAVAASAPFSSYAALVAGYWLLLAGTSVLCMGLVSSSVTEESLRDVENLILATLSFMLLKDALIDAFYFQPQVERLEEQGIEMYRFGMGSTSSNSMGLLAAAAFWMSFKTPSEKGARNVLRFLWRGLFVAVVLLTRTRIALAALLWSGVLRWWFVHRRQRSSRPHSILIAMPCIIVSCVLLVTIGLLWRVPLITGTLDLVNRGEDSDTMMSVTGRTDVWPYAVKRILEGPTSTVFGHGYGTSKSVLNENNSTASFFAYHAHNTFLEVLLSTGVLGALPFLLLVVYSLTWLVRFSWLLESFSLGFALRAATVVSAILNSTMTESELAIKIGPVLVVYLFYVLSLDRQAAFLRAPQLSGE
jgi:O-antigen ligase